MLPLAPLHAALAASVLLAFGANRARRPGLLARAALALPGGLLIPALMPPLERELGGWLVVLVTLAVLVPASLCQRARRRHKVQELLALVLALAIWQLLESSAPLASRLPERLTLPALERLDGELGGAAQAADSPPPTRPQLLVLWRSDCAPCLTQLATIAAHPIPANTAETLLVNQGESLLATLRAAGGQRELVWRDPGQRLQAATGIAGLPLTLLLDHQGRVLKSHLGVLSLREWRRWRSALLRRGPTVSCDSA